MPIAPRRVVVGDERGSDQLGSYGGPDPPRPSRRLLAGGRTVRVDAEDLKVPLVPGLVELSDGERQIKRGRLCTAHLGEEVCGAQASTLGCTWDCTEFGYLVDLKVPRERPSRPRMIRIAPLARTIPCTSQQSPVGPRDNPKVPQVLVDGA